jgi:hypothetical protein
LEEEFGSETLVELRKHVLEKFDVNTDQMLNGSLESALKLVVKVKLLDILFTCKYLSNLIGI